MRKLTLVAVFLSSFAFAQTEKKTVEAKQVPKTQTLIFGDGTEIDGEADHPDIGYIQSAPRPGLKSLIKVRTNFNDKLLQSVHEL